MKVYGLVDHGREEVAKQEVSELLEVEEEIFNSVVGFDCNAGELLKIASRGQSFRRLLLGVERVSDLEAVDFS